MTEALRVRVPGQVERDDATWSETLRIGDEIVMSGAMADAAVRASPVSLGVFEQTLAALGTLGARVEAAGGHRKNIVKLVVYLTDIDGRAEVGRARRAFFGAPPYPCSTLVEVRSLAQPGCAVEIDAWARLDVDLSLI